MNQQDVEIMAELIEGQRKILNRFIDMVREVNETLQEGMKEQNEELKKLKEVSQKLNEKSL